MEVLQKIQLELRGSLVEAVISRTPNHNGFLRAVYFVGVPPHEEYNDCNFEPDMCYHQKHWVKGLIDNEKDAILDAAAKEWDNYWTDAPNASCWREWGRKRVTNNE